MTTFSIIGPTLPKIKFGCEHLLALKFLVIIALNQAVTKNFFYTWSYLQRPPGGAAIVILLKVYSSVNASTYVCSLFTDAYTSWKMKSQK